MIPFDPECPQSYLLLATIDQIAPTNVITEPEISDHSASSMSPLAIKIPPPKVRACLMIPNH